MKQLRESIRRRLTQKRKLEFETLEHRHLLASPQLVAITPNFGDPITDGQVRNVAPSQLTFRFDDTQVLDADSLEDGIQITHGGGDKTLGTSDDVNVTPGFVGLGDSANEAVLRFAEHLPDNDIRIVIVGSGSDPLQNTDGEAFNNGVDVTIDFTLDLGAQVVAVVPQPVSRIGQGLTQARNEIHVYFNDDDLNSISVADTDFYQLFFTNNTATNQDDGVAINPISVSYDDVEDKAILTFADDLANLGPEGNYRLRIGNDQGLPAAPIAIEMTPESDPLVNENSTFDDAFDVGTLDGATRVIQSAIDPQRFTIDLPGSNGEPGHRDIQLESHLEDLADFTDGISTVYYNFQAILSRDIDGFPQFVNLITETQKERAREIFEIFGELSGIQFVETPDTEGDARGITVATGDLAILGGVSNPLGDTGLSGIGPHGLPTALLDNAETGILWSDSEFGGNWFIVAMHQILSTLNLGRATELPPLTIQAGTVADGQPLAGFSAGFEEIFPGSADVIHLQHLFRPESKDIDVYEVSLPTPGTLQLEMIAERLEDSSNLDSVISLFDASGDLIARNDDYFSEDAFVEVDLTSGTYYVAVTASGNTDFDLNIEDSGFGGKTQGDYELRIDFDPAQTTGLLDATGTLFDGDQDGIPGGDFNYWFTVASEQNTIYVDKVGPTSGNTGTIDNPFRFIDNAFSAAAANAITNPGTVVRIVGNGGGDGFIDTLGDNRAYEVGVPLSGGLRLQDGVTMRIPHNVTVMIDAGAIFKLRRANIDVGSFAQGIDNSLGHLQMLGTPDTPVIVTSYHNEAIGLDTFALPTTPLPGDWGGVVFHNDLDRDVGRQVLEDEGIFLNYINNTEISFGGGELLVNSQQRSFSPIEMVEARPTLTFNTITNAANAAIAADPDSFEETLFRDDTFEADYRRVGPDIFHNSILDNTINGLFARIDTLAGEVIDKLTTQARFDDDIVHVITEAFIIQGLPGGPFAAEDPLVPGKMVSTARTDGRLAIDPGIVVKMKDARITVQVGAQLIAEGLDSDQIIFTSLVDDRFGASGTFDTSTDDPTAEPAPGDWGGIYFNYFSTGSIDRAQITFAGGDTPIEGRFADFNPIEIHRANVRIANSRFEQNEDGVDVGDDDRNGRGVNTPAVIFVRGAAPVIANNLFQDNFANNQLMGTDARSPAISIDVNSLQAEFMADWGRSRGFIDSFDDFPPNQGALVRANRLDNTDINGMEVRGGIVTTEVAMDDTDIVHVVFDEIITSNHHTRSGVILQSRPTESVVVKLFGETAGFTAEGEALEIDDRIGGTLQIIGAPSRPVVLTSFFDDSVGAGRDAKGRPQFDTNNDGIGTGGDGGAAPPPPASPGPVTVTGTTTNANVLRDVLLGSGITPVGNATLTGGPNSAGFFEGGSDSIGVPTGIILSSGDANSANGPNTSDLVSGSASLTGDADLDAEFGTTTLDATILEFDFVSTGGDLFFNFVFASDEYNEFVNASFNDVFAFFLDGQNIALIPNTTTPVSINNVNNGNPLGFGATNPQFYNNNDLDDAGGFLNELEYDGFTDVFTATASNLGPGVHTIKLAVSDVGDTIGDSAVFLEAGTFSDTPPGEPAGAGDWRSIRLDKFSNDRNVELISEVERIVFDVDTNGSTDNAQVLGQLATGEKASDDTLRLGFEIHGSLDRAAPNADVDVYSFTAQPGTEVWFDADMTRHSLDVVLELINANGTVLARSDNSLLESQDPSLLANDGGIALEMQRSEFSPPDLFTTNPRDAGMRVVLPGPVNGNPADYFLRVRSNNDDLSDPTKLNDGITTGHYQVQIRLRETDEVPGSTVRFADIRFATNGVEVFGKPEHSPLIAEAGEAPEGLGLPRNNAFGTAQPLGNLFDSDRGTFAVAGMMDGIDFPAEVGSNDVDWYSFTVDHQSATNDLVGSSLTDIVAVTFDVDFADLQGRPDVRLSLFDVSGELLLSSNLSNIADDRPAPLEGADIDDLDRGSIGSGDPLLGPVNLLSGIDPRTLQPYEYFLAVSHSLNAPVALSGNPLVRTEPINSVDRIVEDHIGTTFSSIGSEANTIFDPVNLNAHVDEFHLGDVVLYVNSEEQLFTVDPFTGQLETVVGDGNTPANLRVLPDTALLNPPQALTYRDIAMRGDGRLMALTVGSTNFNLNQNALSGQYREISTGDATLISSNDDGIVTYQFDPNAPPDNRDPNQTPVVYNRGVQFEALVHGDAPLRRVWAVGNIPLDGPSIDPTPLFKFNQNLLYELDANGNVINNPADPDPDAPLSPTDANPRGVLNTGPTFTLSPATDIFAVNSLTGALTDPLFNNPGDILDGTRFTVTDADGTRVVFELDSGPDVRTSAWGPELVRDGEFFVLGDGTQDLTFEYESGPVIVIPFVVQGGMRIAGSEINDGDTFTLFDNATPAASETFEYDSDGTQNVGNSTLITFTAADDLATVVSSTLDAINNAGFNVVAEPSVLDITPNGFVTNFGRISLRNDTQSGFTIGGPLTGVQLEGARGLNDPTAIPIPFEETDDFTAFLQNTVTTVDVNLNNIRAAFAARSGSNVFPFSGTTGDRMSFFGAVNEDFSGVASFTHFDDNSASAAITNPPPGAPLPSATGIRGTSDIQVPFDADDSDFNLANALAQAINFAAQTVFPGTFDVSANALGVNVEISGIDPNTPIESDDSTTVNPAGSNGPGGLVTGLTFVGDSVDGVMYAVSDAGGLYIVENFSNFMNPDTGAGGASLDYIETSADDLLGIEFTGLSTGPQHVEGGRYQDILFATDASGNIYAFNTDGELQPIFLDGATSISTGVTDLQGVTFSTLDFNLWHASTTRGGDPGHGLNRAYDGSRGSIGGGTSFYFGFEDTTAFPDDIRFEYVNGNIGAFNTYDLPGGALGSLTSDTFDLTNFSITDQPKLYFNYFFDGGGGDTPKVYISDDGANWNLLTASFSNSGAWVQAEVDLNAFAGMSDLRFRFDFSTTSGDMNVGEDEIELFTTGGILRGVPGTELNDGDQFNFDGFTFEFDMGFSLLTPVAAGHNIPDEHSFDVTDQNGVVTTFEFDKDGAATGVPIAIQSRDSAVDVALRITEAINAAGLAGVTARYAENRVHLEGATDVVLPLLSPLTLVGDAPGTLDLFADQPVVVHLGMTAEEVAFLVGQAFDQVFTADQQIQAVDGSQFIDQMAFTLNDGTQTLTFEFDDLAINNGISPAGDVEIDFNKGPAPPADTANAIAQAVATAINSSGLNISATVFGSNVSLSGPVVFFDAGTTPLTSTGNFDDPTLFTSVKVDGSLIHTIGHDAFFTGPLPFTNFLPGEDFGFYPTGNPIPPTSGLPGGDFYNPARGQDNAFEGFFIDDIVIGFAERGEMITAATPGETRFASDLPQNFGLIFGAAGPYDLEIRQSTDYASDVSAGVGIITGDLIASSTLIDVFDTNDRLTDAFTIQAPDGIQIQEGEVFRISDGLRTVTFEFDTDGVSESSLDNILIPFAATDFGSDIATLIVEAINDANEAGLTTVSASAILTSNLVQLAGAESVDNRAPDVNTIDITNESPQSNDTLSTAVDTGLSSANPGTIQLKGVIGDNYEINSDEILKALRDPLGRLTPIGGFDVDFLSVQLDAGDVVEIDIDLDDFDLPRLDPVVWVFDSTGQVALDAVLVDFFGNPLPAFNDDQHAPREATDGSEEPLTSPPQFFFSTPESYLRFTAPATDTYYIAISGNQRQTFKFFPDDLDTIETFVNPFGNLVGMTPDGELYQIDPTTGTVANERSAFLTEPMGITVGPFGEVYTIDAADGNLYTLDPNPYNLFTFTSLIGNTGISPLNLSEGDLDFDPITGQLFGISGDPISGDTQLFTVDITTGEATILDVIPAASIGDASALAFDDDGRLFVLDTGLDQLLEIDPETGDVLSTTALSTPLGETAGMDFRPNEALLQFRPDETLYVADGGAGGTDGLYTLDPATGQLTLVGPTQMVFQDGSSPVPVDFAGLEFRAFSLPVTSRGNYEARITVGFANNSDVFPELTISSVTHERFDHRGDSNHSRDQGYTLIRGNIITDSAEFGIVVDSASRDGSGSQPHPGVPRSLREINTQRLVPGVDVQNNIVAFSGTGGIHIGGDPNTNPAAPLAAVPFVRVVNNTIVGTALNDMDAGTPPPPPQDTSGPIVNFAGPTGTISGPVDRVTVSFNEAIAAATFTTADVVTLSGPAGAIAPTAVNALTSTQFEIVFPNQSADGTYTLTIGPDIEDTAGNLMNQDVDVVNGETPDDQFTTTFTIDTTLPISDFDIDIVFPDTSLSPSQQAVFTTAASRWEQIITGDVPDITVPGIGLVDDVRIEATAPFIDGPFGVLGQAGPTFLRPGSSLPADGIMQFDSADLGLLESTGELASVILHEMAHVLGFGTIWTNLGLLTGEFGPNPRFTGAGATLEYESIFGVTEGSVPVENDGGPGTAGGHWEEDDLRNGLTVAFGDELMTGFLSGATQPISRVTVAQFADLGYQVNLSAADAFTPNLLALTRSEGDRSSAFDLGGYIRALSTEEAVLAAQSPLALAADEPNDVLGNAVNAGSGNYSDVGTIGDNPAFFLGDVSLDVDLFRVNLSAGDIIQVDIDADEIGTGLDSVLRVFDSNGVELAVNDDGAGPSEPTTRDSYLVFSAPAGGTFFIGVSGADNVTYNPTQAGSGTGSASTGGYEIAITPFVVGGTGIGIQVENNASPTLLNNVLADLDTGISLDATSQTTVIGGSAYRNNTMNLAGVVSPESFAINIPVDEPLFINPDDRNFYPVANSRIIDSSINILQERAAMFTVTDPIGIAPSPILAPLRDQLGQFRINDASVPSPPGLGSNVFKDRGAIERADFSGPTAELLLPEDNAELDEDPAPSVVSVRDVDFSQFQIQIVDGVVPNDPAFGAGVDDLTVRSSQLTVTLNGTPLQESLDYRFIYDPTNNTITLQTLAFVWAPGVYEITLNNDFDDGIRDRAGNALKSNRLNGETQFTISLGGDVDFGDAPDPPFPTFEDNNGARHVIVAGVQLGATVDGEDDGQPSPSANADTGDDGVQFTSLVVGEDTLVTITASTDGFIDAWMDFNGDGDWLDTGEKIFDSVAVSAGSQDLTVPVPLTADVGSVISRFRFSTSGGLDFTGEASDGEVEDYQVLIGGDPWQNATNPFDINDDGRVDTQDLAFVVSDLITNSSRQLPVPRPADQLDLGFLDISGDGVINTVDLAFLVNQLIKGQFAEPNDTIGEANDNQQFLVGANDADIVAGFIGDNITASGMPRVGPGLDVDMIELQLSAGERLTVDIDSNLLGYPLDSVIRVFDAGGTEVAFSNDDIAPGESPTASGGDSYIDFIAPSDGVYFIGISSFDNDTYNPGVQGSGTSTSGNEGYYEALIQIDPAPPLQSLQFVSLSTASAPAADQSSLNTAPLPPGTIIEASPADDASAARVDRREESPTAATSETVVGRPAEATYDLALLMFIEEDDDDDDAWSNRLDPDHNSEEDRDELFAELDLDLL